MMGWEQVKNNSLNSAELPFFAASIQIFKVINFLSQSQSEITFSAGTVS